MLISEIFESVQGEGLFAGTRSVFVRTTGCNLRCWFCDTPYTSWEPRGIRRPWESVLEDICRFESEHVVLTGGEPMLQPQIVPLTRALRAEGRFITLETAGTVDRPVTADLMSLSPKLSNSTPAAGKWSLRHERLRDDPAVVRRLMRDYPYQLKFVVDQPADLDEIREYLSRFPEVSTSQVWLMPQGITAEELERKGEWLEPAAQQLGFRFCPRLHIEMYGNVRGT